MLSHSDTLKKITVISLSQKKKITCIKSLGWEFCCTLIFWWFYTLVWFHNTFGFIWVYYKFQCGQYQLYKEFSLKLGCLKYSMHRKGTWAWNFPSSCVKKIKIKIKTPQTTLRETKQWLPEWCFLWCREGRSWPTDLSKERRAVGRDSKNSVLTYYTEVREAP